MTMTETNDTLSKARRLIKAATGEEYGDGYIVTDVCVGYAEPGYGSDEAVVVFGNWNPKRFPFGDDPPLTKAEALAPRLGDALERIGAECEWLDEWTTCAHCYRAMRTQADSYSWTMYGALVDECEFVCADCLVQNPEWALPDYINDERRAITWCEPSDLAALGFVKWEPHNEHDYENGWYEGQNDDPSEILAEILSQHEDAEVVFFINYVGQFDLGFAAYVRGLTEDEDN